MMNGNVGNIIDTNLVIKVINKDSKATEIFEKSENIYISIITLGELFYGANKSVKKEYRLLYTKFRISGKQLKSTLLLPHNKSRVNL